ncbi:MAG: flagellar motor switch protein FliM [Chloroflexi bacterium]|jgi:flagellar motor switch protein FliM|nr:flagellar motor switch protein FliM [Chloroflexota bacterium]
MLSQAEIDALLAGSIEIESPDSEDPINLAELMGEKPSESKAEVERQVKPYNFWSPDRFSKEQMRAVEMVHEDLAERLTSSLPSFLRTNMRPRVVHSEQGRFHDFLKDLPTNSLFHMITLAPLPSQMIVTISPEISYNILELRLGGRSEGTKHRRELTEIDQLLLRGLVEHMLNDFKAAWSKIVVVEPALEDSTVNYHWVQMVMGNERVMLITFEMTLQAVTGTMNVYIPFNMLKPIASLLNPHAWIAGQKERHVDPRAREQMLQNLGQVSLPLKAVLGHAQLNFSDLLNLQVGDVIPLDHPLDQDIPVYVGTQIHFSGRVGIKGNQLAVQITGKVHPEKPGSPAR